MLFWMKAAVLPTVAVTAPSTPSTTARPSGRPSRRLEAHGLGDEHAARGQQQQRRALGCHRQERADLDAGAFEHIRAPEVQRHGRDLEAEPDDEADQRDSISSGAGPPLRGDLAGDAAGAIQSAACRTGRRAATGRRP